MQLSLSHPLSAQLAHYRDMRPSIVYKQPSVNLAIPSHPIPSPSTNSPPQAFLETLQRLFLFPLHLLLKRLYPLPLPLPRLDLRPLIPRSTLLFFLSVLAGNCIYREEPTFCSRHLNFALLISANISPVPPSAVASPRLPHSLTILSTSTPTSRSRPAMVNIVSSSSSGSWCSTNESRRGWVNAAGGGSSVGRSREV